MKIRQLVADINGESIIYVTQLYEALKENGYDVEVWSFTRSTDAYEHFDISYIKEVEFTQDTIDELNTCDLVFCNGMPRKKCQVREQYIDLFVNKIKTKRILFSNLHRYRCLVAGYGDILKNKEFLDCFDHYVVFARNNEIFKKIAETVGEDVAQAKYIHMVHPYKFDESKSRWKYFDQKYRRITYLGRLVQIKDPTRLIDMNIGWLKDHQYQTEMRGIAMTISAVNFPNMRYRYENGKMVEPKELSPYVFFPNIKFRKQLGLEKTDMLTHYNNRDERTWVFPGYENSAGLESISWSMFGCDFYNFEKNIYGDQLEYAIFEIVDTGVIPVLDKHTGECCHAYENAEPTEKTLIDCNAGIFVNKDLSNMNDVVKQMNELASDKDKYDEFRNNCFEIFKKHTDPIIVGKSLVNKCMGIIKETH